MKYSIEGVIEKYPTVNIGVLTGTGLSIKRMHPDLEKYKSDCLQLAKELIGSDPIINHPYIASMRNLYRTFGTKPADYHPSAEALVRRAIKTQQLPLINTAVDTYNAVSVRYFIPMGGFDTDLVVGDIVLRFSTGDEAFSPLGEIGHEVTYPGEVVYADDRGVLTRRWNYRDCVETRITEKTINVVMFIDGSPEIPRVEVEKALKELALNLERYCGGSCSTNIADSRTPAIELF
ncbi:MAG: phenylalanine--tRNA ligase beta subunit-related protein [Candidatus Bathyarchaeia archaeon]|jgi:DNA/RNA-binding domain of Phe-tRNA-synthetase-like protein